MTTLDLARHLASEGFCVLPLLPGGKRPAIRWKRLQTERPTDAELVEWFDHHDYEPGIVTGELSGITVIDCDSPEAVATCEATGITSSMTQRTRRGLHLVYRWNGERNTVRLNGMPGVDRRGEGGYVRAYADSAAWTRAAVEAAGITPAGVESAGLIVAPRATTGQQMSCHGTRRARRGSIRRRWAEGWAGTARVGLVLFRTKTYAPWPFHW